MMPNVIRAKSAPFEVEFRCHFNNPDDAYEALPFIHSCLRRRYKWQGTFYGREMFQTGQLLRISEVVEGERTRHYIGWKGQDKGRFANIRQEIDEDITDGIADSSILRLLGGIPDSRNKDDIIRELERLGHQAFMSWNGVDLSGFSKIHGVQVKLMYCEFIRWPWLVELEKMAATEEEVVRCEDELFTLCQRFRLQDNLVKEEPPSLLYARVFG
jgi:adenylate cyclase class IV